MPVTTHTAAIATGVTFAANGVLFATWVTRIPAMRDQVDASVAQVGIALFFLAAGSLTTMPVTGWMSRRWGAAPVCAVTIAWSALLLSTLALVTTPMLLWAGLFVLGLGYGAWDVAMNIHGHYVEREARRAFMPRFHAAWSAGSLGGAALGSAAAALDVPPAVHFPCMAAVSGLAGFAATFRFLSPRPSDQVRRSRSGRWRGAGLNLPLVLLGVLTLCGTLGEGAAADWLALFLVDEGGLSQGVAAAGFTTFTVTMLIGRALGTNIVEWIGRVHAMRVAGLVVAAGVALLLLAPDPALAFGGAVVWGLGVALVFPTAMSAAGDVGSSPESAIALVSTVGYGGFLLGPPLVGFIADGLGIGLGNALWLIVVWGVGITALAGTTRGRASDVEFLDHA